MSFFLHKNPYTKSFVDKPHECKHVFTLPCHELACVMCLISFCHFINIYDIIPVSHRNSLMSSWMRTSSQTPASTSQITWRPTGEPPTLLKWSQPTPCWRNWQKTHFPPAPHLARYCTPSNIIKQERKYGQISAIENDLKMLFGCVF